MAPPAACPECSAGRQCAAVARTTRLAKLVVSSAKQQRWKGKRMRVQDVEQQLRGLVARLKQGGHRAGVECYTALVSALALQPERLAEARSLVEQMEREGEEPDSVCYNALVDGYCRAGKVDEALETVRAMKRTTVSTYNTLIKGYGLAGQPEQAAQLLDAMLADDGRQYPRPNVRTYNTLAAAWCRCGRVEEAWQLLPRMQADSGLQPDVVTYNTLAAAYAEVGSADGIERVLAEMRSACIAPNLRTYAALVRCHCRRGRPDEGLALVSRLKFEGLQPDVVAFNTLIDAYARGGGEECEKVLQLMCDSGVGPDVATFSALMNRWSTAGAVDKAEAVLRRMRHAGVRPDVVALATLAKAYVRASRPRDAESLLEAMAKEHGVAPNVVAYTTVISGWCSIGSMADAARVYSRMVAAGVQPNLHTFQTLIWGYSEARQPHKAEELLTTMRAAGVQPDTRCLDMVADAWCALGLPEEARRIYKAEQLVPPSHKVVQPAARSKMALVLNCHYQHQGGKRGTGLRQGWPLHLVYPQPSITAVTCRC